MDLRSTAGNCAWVRTPQVALRIVLLAASDLPIAADENGEALSYVVVCALARLLELHEGASEKGASENPNKNTE